MALEESAPLLLLSLVRLAWQALASGTTRVTIQAASALGRLAKEPALRENLIAPCEFVTTNPVRRAAGKPQVCTHAAISISINAHAAAICAHITAACMRTCGDDMHACGCDICLCCTRAHAAAICAHAQACACLQSPPRAQAPTPELHPQITPKPNP